MLSAMWMVLLQDGWKEGQYWDTADPYHYVRAAKHEDKGLVLIVGGEDHNTGIKPSEYEVGPPSGLLHDETTQTTNLKPLHAIISEGDKPCLSWQKDERYLLPTEAAVVA